MELALEFIEKHGLPPEVMQTKKAKKRSLSTLQNELLSVFDLEPTEQQMKELTAFLHQLFGEQITKNA